MVKLTAKVLTMSAAIVTYMLTSKETICYEGEQERKCDLSAESQLSNTFTQCISLLNKGCHWISETSNFAKSSAYKLEDNATSLFQLMRAREQLEIPLVDEEHKYENNNSCHEVPLMRVVSFLPNTTCDEVYTHLFDLQRRPEWDANYEKYVEFNECRKKKLDVIGTKEEDKSWFLLEKFKRPLKQFVTNKVVCDGSSCSIKSDICITEQDHGWFAHRVGNNMLKKLGMHSRLFMYERMTYKYSYKDINEFNTNVEITENQDFNQESIDTEDHATIAYDVLFHGTKDKICAFASMCKEFQEWWTHLIKEAPSELVEMHYQHIMLLPIADVKTQLLERPTLFDQLAVSRSITSTSSTELMYNILKETNKLERGSAKRTSGTLLVMTSANDVRVPYYLPQWLQKKIASSVGWYAHCALRDAILQNKKSVNNFNSIK